MRICEKNGLGARVVILFGGKRDLSCAFTIANSLLSCVWSFISFIHVWLWIITRDL